MFKPNDLSVFYQHMKNKESDIQIKIDKFVNEFLSIIEKWFIYIGNETQN